MSNVFQNALANSALVAVLDSSKTPDVFHYKTTATPTIATERIVLDPLGGATTHGNTVVRFELPRYGLLSKLIVKLDIKYVAAADAYAAGNPPIVNAIEYYEIVSQNRVLSRMTRENIISALAELSESEQNNVALAAGHKFASGAGIANNEAFTVYLPWMGKISGLSSALNERWDTGFTERLEFRVKFRDTQSVKKQVSANAVTFENCKLITFFDIMKETDLKALRQANYGAGPLVLLNTSTFTEGTKELTIDADTAEAPQSFSIPIHCNGVTPKTVISVRQMTSGADGNTLTDTTDGLAIDKITLSGSGRELLSFDGRELMHLGRSSYMSGQKYQNIITIDWSCGKKLPGYSGGVSWREIASPELKIEFTHPTVSAAGDATFKCIVTHMQYDLLSVLPSNGRVQQSIST